MINKKPNAEAVAYTTALRLALDKTEPPRYLDAAPDYVINGDALEIEAWLAENGLPRPTCWDVSAERRRRLVAVGIQRGAARKGTRWGGTR